MTTTTILRTDIHRPSVINPIDYQFVGLEHQKIDGLAAIYVVQQERARIDAHMKQTGGTYSNHEHGGNCHICGAHCIYTALFYHESTNSYIRTGMDCAQKLDMGDERRFRVFKDAIQAAQEHRAGKRKAEGILTQAGLLDAWKVYVLMSNEELTEPVGELLAKNLKVGNGEVPFEERTIYDIVGKLVKYGSLSQRQEQFLGSLLNRICDRDKIEQKRAAEKAAALDAPTGRKTVHVTVLKTDMRETSFGETLKMLVKSDDGWTAWGTVPRNVCRTDTRRDLERRVDRNDRLELTATFKPSDNDSKFGFFSRPSARYIVPKE